MRTQPPRPGSPGTVVWLTGLSGSGKSTLAATLRLRLRELGIPAHILDGDHIRQGLSSDLGFSPAARSENVRRAAHVGVLLAEAGLVAIASLISPLRSDRDQARAIAERAGHRFLEVFVSTPLEECERRDVKGLYARARRGELREFTGISAPYEPPPAPDLVVSPGDSGIEELLACVLAAREPG